MRSCVNGTHLRRFATQITQNDSPLSTDSWSRTVNVLACGRQHTPFSQSHVFHPRQIIKDISWLLAECLSPTSCYRRSIRHCLYFLDSPCILSPCLNFLWIFFSVHCSFSHLWCGICSMNVIQSLSASRKTSSVRAVTDGSVSLFSKTFWCRNSSKKAHDNWDHVFCPTNAMRMNVWISTSCKQDGDRGTGLCTVLTCSGLQRTYSRTVSLEMAALDLSQRRWWSSISKPFDAMAAPTARKEVCNPTCRSCAVVPEDQHLVRTNLSGGSSSTSTQNGQNLNVISAFSASYAGIQLT